MASDDDDIKLKAVRRYQPDDEWKTPAPPMTPMTPPGTTTPPPRNESPSDATSRRSFDAAEDSPKERRVKGRKGAMRGGGVGDERLCLLLDGLMALLREPVASAAPEMAGWETGAGSGLLANSPSSTSFRLIEP